MLSGTPYTVMREASALLTRINVTTVHCMNVACHVQIRLLNFLTPIQNLTLGRYDAVLRRVTLENFHFQSFHFQSSCENPQHGMPTTAGYKNACHPVCSIVTTCRCAPHYKPQGTHSVTHGILFTLVRELFSRSTVL